MSLYKRLYNGASVSKKMSQQLLTYTNKRNKSTILTALTREKKKNEHFLSEIDQMYRTVCIEQIRFMAEKR